MSLSQERLTTFAGVYPSRGSYPIAANKRTWKGGIICLDSSGNAIPGTVAASGTVKCVGVASHSLNNLTGSDLGGAAGAADQEVAFGVHGFDSGLSSDAITADDIGEVAYVIDDNTVGLTDGGGAARVPAGVITEVRDGQVFVWMGPHVSALISGAAL